MRYEIKPVTLGKMLKHVDIGGFILTYTHHPPAMTIPPHVHELASVSFTLAGHFIEVVGKERYDCSPDTLLIKPAGQVHANRYGKEGARCLIVEIKPERMGGIRRYSSAFSSPAQLKEGAGSIFAARIYKEFRLMDGVSPLAIEGLLLEMLAQSERAAPERLRTRPPEWLREAKELIHARFADRLSLSVVAGAVSVHPAHFARVFKKYFRCSVGDYVRRLRLDHAASELARSDRPLAEIALNAGFYDHSHFSNTFKLHVGLSPAQYRSLAKTRKPGTP